MDRVFGACDDRVKLYGLLGKCVDHLVADTEMALDDFRCIPEGKRRLSLRQQHKHRLSIPLSDLQPLAWHRTYCHFANRSWSSRLRLWGFEIVENELHATKGNDCRPFIVARKV